MQRQQANAQRARARRKPTGYAGRYTTEPHGVTQLLHHPSTASPKPTAAQPFLKHAVVSSNSLPPSRSQSPFVVGGNSSAGGTSPSQTQHHSLLPSSSAATAPNVNAGAVRRTSDAHTFGERASHMLRSAAAFQQRSVDHSPFADLPRPASADSLLPGSVSVPPLAPSYHADPAQPPLSPSPAPPNVRYASASQPVDPTYRERSSSRTLTDPPQRQSPQLQQRIIQQHRRWHSHGDTGGMLRSGSLGAVDGASPVPTITVVKGSTTVLRIIGPSPSPVQQPTAQSNAMQSPSLLPPTAGTRASSWGSRVSPPNPEQRDQPSLAPRSSPSPPTRSTSAPAHSAVPAMPPTRRLSPSPLHAVPPPFHHHRQEPHVSLRSQSPSGTPWPSSSSMPMQRFNNSTISSPAPVEVKQYGPLRSLSPQASNYPLPTTANAKPGSATAALFFNSHCSVPVASTQQRSLPLSTRSAATRALSRQNHAPPSSIGLDAPQIAQPPAPVLPAGAASYRTVMQASWEKLCCAAAADSLSPHDLRLLSCETLRSLVDRYHITSAEEVAHIEAHWALLQDDLLLHPLPLRGTPTPHHLLRHHHHQHQQQQQQNSLAIAGGVLASPTPAIRTSSPVVAAGSKDNGVTAPSPAVERFAPTRSVSATKAGASPVAVAPDRLRSQSPAAQLPSLAPHGEREHISGGLTGGLPFGADAMANSTTAAAAAAPGLRFVPQEVDLKGFAQWAIQQERHQRRSGSASPSTAAAVSSSTAQRNAMEMDLSLPNELKARAKISGRRRLLSGESIARADPSVPLRDDRPWLSDTTPAPTHASPLRRASAQPLIPPYSTATAEGGLFSPPEKVRCSVSLQSTPPDLLFGPTLVGSPLHNTNGNGSPPTYRRLSRAGETSPGSASSPRTAFNTGIRTGLQPPNQLTLS